MKTRGIEVGPKQERILRLQVPGHSTCMYSIFFLHLPLLEKYDHRNSGSTQPRLYLSKLIPRADVGREQGPPQCFVSTSLYAHSKHYIDTAARSLRQRTSFRKKTEK